MQARRVGTPRGARRRGSGRRRVQERRARREPREYFAERTSIPRFYQVHLGDRHFESGPVTVLPFGTFCRELSLP